MVVVGLLGVVIVQAGPETFVHAPVPSVGVFAAIVTEATEGAGQTVWSGPASGVVGMAELVIVKEEFVAEQPPPVTSHL